MSDKTIDVQAGVDAILKATEGFEPIVMRISERALRKIMAAKKRRERKPFEGFNGVGKLVNTGRRTGRPV